MFNLGFGEILVILILGLLILGPKRLPDTFRFVGKTIRDLRRTTNELRDTWDEAVSDPKHLKEPEKTHSNSLHSIQTENPKA